MKVGIFPEPEAVADAAADQLMRTMRRAEDPALGVATGSTPLPLYARLRDAHAAGEFTLAGMRAFALDEYVGLPADHPEDYRNVLRAELVGDDRTGLREEDLFTPDGCAADPDEEAIRYEHVVRDAAVDLQILGIGANGHIGFNEPGTSLASRTHVDALAVQTRTDNARFFGGDLAQVPELCLTQGLATIMQARSVLLIATGANKANAVRELVEGGVTSRWPATVLQWHEDVTVMLDEAAAARLELAAFYRERWEITRRRDV